MTFLLHSQGYFNPRSPRGERLSGRLPVSCARQISIHAPRVGSDHFSLCSRFFSYNFNPRSPRGERLSAHTFFSIERIEFQSTLPAWGATLHRAADVRAQLISIHAPRVGSDFEFDAPLLPLNVFQSTLPAWGATFRARYSLHDSYFNPRSPRGERRARQVQLSPVPYFNPRSPRGERLDFVTGVFTGDWISIHAPRVGSDLKAAGLRWAPKFQSTLPAWGATLARAHDG